MKTAGAAAATLAISCAKPAVDEEKKNPNIIFIMADDLGYGDLRCLNAESKIPTPNMDRLAAEGRIFTDAHSGSAVCTPTRYGVLTGRYAWRTRLKEGVLWGYSPSLIDPQRTTVASLLKANGYGTACVGKWHLGLNWRTTGRKLSDRMDETGEGIDYGKPYTGGPNELGFDYFYGIPSSLDMVPYVYLENDRVVEAPTETVEASEKGKGGFWRRGPVAPGFRHIDVLPVITEKAVGYIEKHTAGSPEQPFFLYFPLTAPHTPWVPTEDFKGESRAGDYGDFVAQVDGTVGEILKALDRLGNAGNTLVVMTSDNGSHWPGEMIERFDHHANHLFRGMKSDVWDGGHRIPYIARWPEKIRPGTECDETLCLTDLLATSAAIAGTDLPENAGEDSCNMLPALLDQAYERPIREATVHHSISGMFAIRRGQWKLITGKGSGGWSRAPREDDPPGQLYNLEEDIGETNNLYYDRPELVGELTALLERYKREGRSR